MYSTVKQITGEKNPGLVVEGEHCVWPVEVRRDHKPQLNSAL